MTELYDIPKRLKRRTGFFGTIKPIDIGITAVCLFFGVIALITFESMTGVGIFAVLALGSYFIFIFKDKYDENYRVKLRRQLEFLKNQKVFYYYRGTGKPDR